MNKLVSVLHDATHLVPGVPTHRNTTATQRPHQSRTSSRLHNRSPRMHSPRRHHQTPPRVLVAWQTWIGKLVGHSNHR